MEWLFAQEVGTVLSRSGPKSNAMGQVGGGAFLSYPQDHAPRSCSVLFARYFVIVISCVVYFISSLALTGLLSQSGGFVSVITVLPFLGPSLVDVLCG